MLVYVACIIHSIDLKTGFEMLLCRSQQPRAVKAHIRHYFGALLATEN